MAGTGLRCISCTASPKCARSRAAPRMRARSAMSCSVMPSAKYSCSGSPDRFSSGRTATDRIWPSDAPVGARSTLSIRAMRKPAMTATRMAAAHGHVRRERACGALTDRFGDSLQLADDVGAPSATARRVLGETAAHDARRSPAAPAAAATRPAVARARGWRRGRWSRRRRRTRAFRSAFRRGPRRTRTDRFVRPPQRPSICSGAI